MTVVTNQLLNAFQVVESERVLSAIQ